MKTLSPSSLRSRPTTAMPFSAIHGSEPKHDTVSRRGQCRKHITQYKHILTCHFCIRPFQVHQSRPRMREDRVPSIWGSAPGPRELIFVCTISIQKSTIFCFPAFALQGQIMPRATAAQVRTRSTGPRASPPAQVKHPTASLHQYKQVLFFVCRHLLPWLRGNLFGRSSQGP